MLAIFCALSVAGTALCHADEPSMPKEPIVVNGDSVEYYQDKKEVIGTGNIMITYQDVVLTCDKIIVNLTTHDSEATGNVKVTQKDAYFSGDKMIYNFDTRQGSVVGGYLNAKPIYGRASSLEKEANKDEFGLKNGYITTCDFDKPHYRIEAKQVKVYLNDKIVARNIFLYIGNVPVLYLPYYVQPLTGDRKSHITVMPGQGKDWGYYALIAYRYYFSDKSKGDILLDYRSKKGLAEGINHYLDSDVGKGAFKFYYTHENDSLAYEKTGDVQSRYRYQYRHRWDIENTDTTAIFEFNKLSDPNVIKDYFYNEYEEIGDTPDNYLTFITSKRDFSTEFTLRKSFNKFYTVVERLPEYKIDILNYRIGDSSFYYSGQASGVYLNKTYGTFANVSEQKDVSTIRFDASNKFSYAARFFRALSVTPYALTRQTYYSRNKWGDTNEIRTLFTEGVDTSMKFYKVYDVQSDFMGLDINKLRHIITPTANYYHTHQPTISPDNLNQFDEIDAFDTENGVKLGLENRLQTKRMEGDQMKSVDLMTFTVSSDYMFRLDKDFWSKKSDKFRSVDMKLELIPYSWLYITSDMSINTKKYMVQSTSFDVVAYGGDKWSLATSFRYEDVETGKTTLISLDGTYKINDKWKIRAYERFNAEKGSFEEQEYTISRDLHCWVAELTYSIAEEFSNHTFWIVFKLKAFPDYPVGIQQTYSRPRFGSTGTTDVGN